ncbi:MAG: ArsA family ATPase, partial [Chloroflexi bacterium]|nr:ArsA family ATPase [Chloroflexota bacterium]
MRIILCSGKGGVGKTSVAAATAVQSAEFGHRTITFSTDIAHSLGDSFDVAVGYEPTKIAENLWAQETSMSHTVRVYWETIQKWLSALLTWRGIEGVVAEDMAILPGMDELASLLYIVNYAASKDYDVVIVDCAPTGETLRLLSFPEILHWWVDKMFPIGRTATNLIRPFVRPVLNIPLPDKEVFDSAKTLFDELDAMHHLLTNPGISSTRIIVNPEKMVVREAQRLFTYLNLYGYFTDLIICNRLIPEEVQDSYFVFWKESQANYLKVIKESFAPLPIFTVPMFNQEVIGMDRLKMMGRAIYGDNDPA